MKIIMEESLWEAECKGTNFPKLSRDEKADICIVGGGIVGAVTAYLLVKAGKKVIVLEKDKVGMGVTAKSTAKLTSQHGLFYKYLENKNGLCMRLQWPNASPFFLILLFS